MGGGGGGSADIKETPEQKELAKVAAEKWNYSQQHLAPLMDKYMAQTDQMASENALSYQRGRSNETAQTQQAQQDLQANDALRRAGLDPSSGRAQMTHTQLKQGQAEAAGENAGRIETEQLNQHVLGLQNITAIGQGEASQAQAGMGALASQGAQQQQQNAFNAFNRRSANLQLVGSLAGAGASYGLNQPSSATPANSSNLMMKSAQNATPATSNNMMMQSAGNVAPGGVMPWQT